MCFDGGLLISPTISLMLCVTFSAILFMAFLSFMIVQVKEAECEDEELHCICRKLAGKCVGIALCDTGK